MLSQLLHSLMFLSEPLGFAWGLLVLSASRTLWRRQFRLGAGLAAIALLMYVVGATSLPGTILATLERPHVRVSLEQVPPADAIIALGGSVQPSRYEAFHLDFTAAADRPIMALELMRLGKATVLVLGGSGGEIDHQPLVEADLMKQWLAAWGLPQGEVISLGRCENTHDEALKTRQLAGQRGWKKIILVTSAYHMRRATATFQAAGLQVESVACDYQTSVSLESSSSWSLVPRYQGFHKLALYLREVIGWRIYRWRSWA
jgi:uncharacterized SAM-binding protein YcdF (DUF218 family)